jgi:hypothetical protein
MFKFDFGIEDDSDQPELPQAEETNPEVAQSEPFTELPLSQLVRVVLRHARIYLFYANSSSLYLPSSHTPPSRFLFGLAKTILPSHDVTCSTLAFN